jgi:two-component system response regulator AlgR
MTSRRRARLVHVLNAKPEFEPIGEAANGMEAVQLVQMHRPGVVLMDIRMPGMEGLEASCHLAQMDEPPAIIFTATYSEHALEVFDSHAVAYLVKPIR